MTFMIRKHSIGRNSVFKDDIVAFINSDYESDSYPTGMREFWCKFSLATGHRHAKLGYSIPDACQQLGVDIEDVRRRYGIKARYRGESHVSRGGSVDIPVSD